MIPRGNIFKFLGTLLLAIPLNIARILIAKIKAIGQPHD